MTAMTHDEVTGRLRAAGCVFAEDEADLLLAAPVDGAGLAVLVARRCAGEPLETVLGWVAFAGLRLAVTPGVFVPRRRTEVLVDVVDGLLVERGGRAVVVDLCCGVGAVGAAVLARHPDAQVHAADVDPAAVACARTNLPPDVVHHGDLFGALPGGLRGRVDVLVANAPYVPTEAIVTMPPEARDHEAAVALDGGPDGLDVHRRIARGVVAWLSVAGAVVVESSVHQATTTAALLRDAGLVVDVVRDDERDGTAVVGRRAPDVVVGPGRAT